MYGGGDEAPDGRAAIIALGQHYEIAAFRSLQPVTAAAIPPLAWAAFLFSAVRRPRLPHDLLHLAGPVLALAALLAAWRGADSLPRLPFEAGGAPGMVWPGMVWPGMVWKVIALSLIVSALGDGLIAAAVLGGRGGWMPWIVALLSSVTLVAVGGLVLVQRLRCDERDAVPNAPPIPRDPEEDEVLMARLDAVLESRKLYLDPELSLMRLAQVLHVPVKRLSAAINRSTGGNVSRHVNAYRIREACRALEGGANVTDAMLASGFNTKSNFNREFRRFKDRLKRWRRRRS